MNVKHFLFSMLLAVFFVSLTNADDQRPNVVLFLVDDMGWMDSSAYGSRYYETPHMERLAAQSMRFTDAYAVPLCSPTRASILTGQHSARHGITSASGHRPPAPEGASPYPKSAPAAKKFLYAESKNYLDPKFITLAEVLREAGYRTGHFGKWHLGIMPEHRPEKHGFETAWHSAPDPGPPAYFSPYGVHPDGRPAGQRKVGTITDGPKGEYITDRVTDEALKFIEAHRGEPFFLNLWHFGVHGPWGHKEEDTAQFAKKTDPRGKQKNPIMASMLKSVDQSLGRVLAKLDELDLAENTLFIFYSDNGGNTHSNTPDDRKMQNVKPGQPRFSFVQDWKKWAGPEPPTNNAPLREGKGRIYEGGQRVPLMIRWPGKIEPASTCDTVVGAIDLYPTILDAINIDKPANHTVDGVSILPLLKQSGTISREAYFTWFPHLIPAVSVRKGDWKLIRRFEPHPQYPETRELYNLKEDIGETKNLAESMPEKVEELEALIDRFIRETGALAPKPNPAYNPQAALAAEDIAAGLVARMCKMTRIEGALRIEQDGRTPFLGTGQVKHAGPLTLQLRIRSDQGGTGHIQWKTAGQDMFPPSGQKVEYEFAGGKDWQDVNVRLPAEGRMGIIRLYLPAAPTVEIQSIEYTSDKDGKTIRKWDFSKSQSEPAGTKP